MQKSPVRLFSEDLLVNPGIVDRAKDTAWSGRNSMTEVGHAVEFLVSHILRQAPVL